MAILGVVDFLSPTELRGWAFREEAPHEHLAIEVALASAPSANRLPISRGRIWRRPGLARGTTLSRWRWKGRSPTKPGEVWWWLRSAKAAARLNWRWTPNSNYRALTPRPLGTTKDSSRPTT